LRGQQVRHVTLVGLGPKMLLGLGGKPLTSENTLATLVVRLEKK
jgi:hypothetical protein